MLPDIHPIFIIQIIRCLLQHHAEEDAEESQWESLFGLGIGIIFAIE